MKAASFGLIFGAVTLGVIMGGGALLFGPPMYRQMVERVSFDSAPKLLVGYSYAVCHSEFAAEMIQQHSKNNNDGKTVDERLSFFDCERAPTAEVQVIRERNGVIEAKAATQGGGHAMFYFIFLQ